MTETAPRPPQPRIGGRFASPHGTGNGTATVHRHGAARLEGATVHPLIEALIATLRQAGPGWPRAERETWLKLAAMSFDLAFGVEEPIAVNLTPATAVSIGTAPVAATVVAAAETVPPSAHEVSGASYYVDRDGYARCDFQLDGQGRPVPTPGRRVTAEEALGADDPIYDYRGAARDRDTVTWADDSQGALAGMAFCGPG